MSQSMALRFKNALEAANLPFFVARLGQAGVLRVGTLEASGRTALKRDIETRLSQFGLTARVRVESHSASKLRKRRSLQSLLCATGAGEIVFDRTRALSRAEAVVELGTRLRAELGRGIEGLFFQAELRSLFVILAPNAASDTGDRDRLLARIVAVREVWERGDNADFGLLIRIGREVPSGLELIAVDRQTVRAALLRMLRRPIQSKFGAVVLGSVLGGSITVPALAADLIVTPPPGAPQASMSAPAVDAPNLSVTALSGVANDPVLFDHVWAGLAVKGTIPLGERFGAQLDVGVATDQYYGAALHLFARDPSMGLVGIIGSAESKYGVTMNRIGAEVDYYLTDNFTVGARVGYQTGTAPNGAYGDLKVKFYPDPNFAINAGVEAQPTFVVGSAGFEWRPAVDALAGMSLSADGSVTSTGDYRATFGLHFQLGGKSKTLVERDRRSDPDLGVFNTIDVSSAVKKAPGYVGPG